MRNTILLLDRNNLESSTLSVLTIQSLVRNVLISCQHSCLPYEIADVCIPVVSWQWNCNPYPNKMLIKVMGYLLRLNILFYVKLIFCGSYTYSEIHVHVRGRVCKQQASSRQTNSARLIETFGEVARCWLPTCEVTSFVRLIIIT